MVKTIESFEWKNCTFHEMEVEISMKALKIRLPNPPLITHSIEFLFRMIIFKHINFDTYKNIISTSQFHTDDIRNKKN